MAIIDDLADSLARRALELEETTGDEDIPQKVADAVGASSPTMQEAFATALRIRRAYRRADLVIEELTPEKLKALPKPEE